MPRHQHFYQLVSTNTYQIGIVSKMLRHALLCQRICPSWALLIAFNTMAVLRSEAFHRHVNTQPHLKRLHRGRAGETPLYGHFLSRMETKLDEIIRESQELPAPHSTQRRNIIKQSCSMITSLSFLPSSPSFASDETATDASTSTQQLPPPQPSQPYTRPSTPSQKFGYTFT